MKPWQIILWSVLGLTLLVLAIVQAVQGDWAPAIFFAVLWVGLTNNTSNTILGYAIQPEPEKMIKR